MKLTLRQAIDKKTELVNSLRRKNELVQANNCVKHDSPLKKTSVVTIIAEIDIGNENLDTLKYEILKANYKGNMQQKIYQLRTKITKRSNLTALGHKIITGEGYSTTMSQSVIDISIATLNGEIRSLQTELDTFNKDTTIEFNPKIIA